MVFVVKRYVSSHLSLRHFEVAHLFPKDPTYSLSGARVMPEIAGWLVSKETNKENDLSTNLTPLILPSLIMDAVQNLPPHQQQQFMQHLEQMQTKDSLS